MPACEIPEGSARRAVVSSSAVSSACGTGSLGLRSTANEVCHTSTSAFFPQVHPAAGVDPPLFPPGLWGHLPRRPAGTGCRRSASSDPFERVGSPEKTRRLLCRGREPGHQHAGRRAGARGIPAGSPVGRAVSGPGLAWRHPLQGAWSGWERAGSGLGRGRTARPRCALTTFPSRGRSHRKASWVLL